MAQYRTGTALPTQGSNQVTGTNTTWQTDGIAAGDLFCMTGEGVYYKIISVQSDTALTLASNYVAATRATAAAYQIQVDFTPNNQFPTPTYGDSDVAALIEQTLLAIDAKLAVLSPVPSVIQGSLRMQGALQISGVQLDMSFGNSVINGAFSLNQAGYASGNALAAGAVGHDRWKGGAAGATYTFTQAIPDTQITITQGSLVQTIDAHEVTASTMILSWVGTAQGAGYQSGSATFSAGNPATLGARSVNFLVLTGLTPGQSLTLEFGTGTLCYVQLEEGLAAEEPTRFMRRPYAIELMLSNAPIV